MAIEQVDAPQGAGEAIYKGFAKVNQAIIALNTAVTKLATIETGATADLVGAEIKVLLEALVDKLSIETGVKETTDYKILTATERAELAANVAKLIGIEAGAKDDQTAGEIVTLLEALVGDAQLSLAKIKDTAAYKKLTAARQTAIDNFLSNYFVDGVRKLSGDLNANNHSINNLLGVGAVPISAAQWGMLGAGVEWTAWVPNLTGGADLSGYDMARYFRFGKICFFYFTAGGANVTTAGGILVTLPFTVANTSYQTMSGVVYDGTTWVAGAYKAVYANTNTFRVYKTAQLGDWLGTETGVNIRVSGFFEIA